MAKCEHCGEENGYRKKCDQCGRRVCRWCERVVGYFCNHGNVPAVSLDSLSSGSKIKKYNKYLD